MKKKIEEVLNSIREALELHGGDIEVTKINAKSGTVYVKFLGACEHCSISEITLRGLIERTILTRVPKVRKVVAQNFDSD